MKSPAEIAENYIKVGLSKMSLEAMKMLWLSVLAGAFIAFGALGSQAAAVSIPLPSVAKLAGAMVFPVGLMMVLTAGSELFTGNNLLVIPVLMKKASVKHMLKSWIIVYTGNFIGGVLIAFAATQGHIFSMFDNGLAASVVSTACAKTGMTFSDAFIRGILCNFLVCIAVWVSFAASELAGKIIALMLPVMLFVLCGFEHCVANMYFIPAGIFASAEYGIKAPGLGWGSFLLKNLLPVTLGNLTGGALLVGCGYWFVYLRKSSKK